ILEGAQSLQQDWKKDNSTTCVGFEARTSEEWRDRYELELATLLPGKYRLKCEYDVTPPWGDLLSGVAVLNEGDYESSVSDIIEVTAGTTVSGLRLTCTNLVAIQK